MHPTARLPFTPADLAAPEPLSAADAKDAAPLIDLAGEYLARCLHSRTWQLREAGLAALARDLAAGRVQGVAGGSAGAAGRWSIGLHGADGVRGRLPARLSPC